MNLNYREKILLFIALVLVISMLVYSLGIERYLSKSRELDSKIFLMQLKLKKELKFLTQSKDIINEYNSVKAGINEVSTLLRYIERLSVTYDIRTKNIQPSSVKRDGLHKSCVIRLQVEGKWQNLLSFIDKLCEPPARLYIKSFAFKSTEDNPQVLRCSITFSAFLI